MWYVLYRVPRAPHKGCAYYMYIKGQWRSMGIHPATYDMAHIINEQRLIKRVNKKCILSLRLPSKCSFTLSKLRFFGLRKPKTTSFYSLSFFYNTLRLFTYSMISSTWSGLNHAVSPSRLNHVSCRFAYRRELRFMSSTASSKVQRPSK